MRPLRVLMILAVPAVVVILAVALDGLLKPPSGYALHKSVGYDPDASYYVARSEPVASSGNSVGTTIQSWRMSLPLRGKWEALEPRTSLRRSLDGLAVTTTPERSAYQLVSPPLRLRAGPYRIALDGLVRSGGIQIGVLLPRTRRCVDNAFFAGDQANPQGTAGSSSTTMALSFRLAQTETVRIVLANWQPVDQSSVWLLHRVNVESLAKVVRAEALQRYYRLQETALSSPRVLEAPAFGVWSFEHGLPGGWLRDGNVRTAASSRGLSVRTGAGKVAYQIVMDAPTSLPAGTFTAVVRGSVTGGGLLLGVLDSDRDTWVAPLGHFWSGQRGFGKSVMAVPFTLKHAANIRLILANWAQTGRSSSWVLRSATIVGS
jgi:hypothetical protein